MLNPKVSVIIWEKNFRKFHPDNITYCKTPREALKDTDICFIFTEWPEIKALTYEDFKLMKNPLIMDGRDCYDIRIMEKYPMVYESIGRSTVKNI